MTLGLLSVTNVIAANGKDAQIHRSQNPIIDAQGRVQMIIDFDFDPKSDTEFAHGTSPANEKKWDQHQGKIVNLLDHYEKLYGFTRSGMTSWAKTSATAFLDTQQVDRLVKDKRVSLLTENQFEKFSTWDNISVNGEFRSWGWQATTNNTPRISNSGRPIYIIDSGVGYHTDLSSVSSRVNMACGTSLTNCSDYSATDNFPVVGCYPHSMHVAGIIGATAFNDKAGMGVSAGAIMISVSVVKVTASGYQGMCANSTPQLDAIGYALDYVYRQILTQSQQPNNGVPLVNISINPGRFGFMNDGSAETNRAALLKLATPAPTWFYSGTYPNGTWTLVDYIGAFVAQSAGNLSELPSSNMYGPDGKNLCTEYVNQIQLPVPSLAYTHAFPNNNTTSATDGIMVVGAMHHDGKPVDLARNTFNGVPTGESLPFSGRYDSTGLVYAPEQSSVYGPCVDVWAPGNLIYSTYGRQAELPDYMQSVVGTEYSAIGTTGPQGWIFLSGTSMSAPHVIGAAAVLADAQNLQTPAAIEQAVRARFMQNGFRDRSGTFINYVQLP